jgi:hypothetical protein
MNDTSDGMSPFVSLLSLALIVLLQCFRERYFGEDVFNFNLANLYCNRACFSLILCASFPPPLRATEIPFPLMKRLEAVIDGLHEAFNVYVKVQYRVSYFGGSARERSGSALSIST